MSTRKTRERKTKGKTKGKGIFRSNKMKIITMTTKRQEKKRQEKKRQEKKRQEKKRQQKAQIEQRKKHLKKLLKELKLKEFKNIQERKAHIQSIKTLSEQAPSLKSTAPIVADILLRFNLDEDSARQILEKLEKREKLINQAKKNYLIKLQELLNKIDDIDPTITEDRELYLPTLSESDKTIMIQKIENLNIELNLLIEQMGDAYCASDTNTYCEEVIKLIEDFQTEVSEYIHVIESQL